MGAQWTADVLTSYYDCDGDTEELTTERNPGESDADMRRRHFDKLEELEEACGTFALKNSEQVTDWTCNCVKQTPIETERATGEPWAPFFAAHDAKVATAFAGCTS